MIMAIYNNKDLASIYPRPKSYDEIEHAREIRKPKLRSRLVAIKIGLSVTFALIVILMAYNFIVSTFVHNLSTMGSVFYGTFFAFFIAIVAGIILFTINSYINDFVRQFYVATVVFYTVIALVVGATAYMLVMLIQNKNDDVLQVIAVLLINFTLTTLSVNYMFRQRK